MQKRAALLAVVLGLLVGSTSLGIDLWKDDRYPKDFLIWYDNLSLFDSIRIGSKDDALRVWVNDPFSSSLDIWRRSNLDIYQDWLRSPSSPLGLGGPTNADKFGVAPFASVYRAQGWSEEDAFAMWYSSVPVTQRPGLYLSASEAYADFVRWRGGPGGGLSIDLDKDISQWMLFAPTPSGQTNPGDDFIARLAAAFPKLPPQDPVTPETPALRTPEPVRSLADRAPELTNRASHTLDIIIRRLPFSSGNTPFLFREVAINGSVIFAGQRGVRVRVIYVYPTSDEALSPGLVLHLHERGIEVRQSRYKFSLAPFEFTYLDMRDGPRQMDLPTLYIKGDGVLLGVDGPDVDFDSIWRQFGGVVVLGPVGENVTGPAHQSEAQQSEVWTIGPDFWLLTSAGVSPQETMEFLAKRGIRPGLFGGRMDYIHSRLPEHEASLRKVDSLLLFNVTAEGLSALTELPPGSRFLIPFSVEELRSYGPPFAWLRRESEGRVRGVVVATSSGDARRFTEVMAVQRVPLGVPWTLDSSGRVNLLATVNAAAP